MLLTFFCKILLQILPRVPQKSFWRISVNFRTVLIMRFKVLTGVLRGFSALGSQWMLLEFFRRLVLKILWKFLQEFPKSFAQWFLQKFYQIFLINSSIGFFRKLFRNCFQQFCRNSSRYSCVFTFGDSDRNFGISSEIPPNFIQTFFRVFPQKITRIY